MSQGEGRVVDRISLFGVCRSTSICGLLYAIWNNYYTYGMIDYVVSLWTLYGLFSFQSRSYLFTSTVL